MPYARTRPRTARSTADATCNEMSRIAWRILGAAVARRCACRLHLDAAGSQSRLQESGRRRARRVACGYRPRCCRPTRAPACTACRLQTARSSPSGSKSRTARTAPTTCCRRDSIRTSFPLPKRPKRLHRTSRRSRKPSSTDAFVELAFRNPVLPGATTSGFVLTNLDEGFKFVQIDLVTSGRARTFSILAIVPGFRSDYRASEVFRRDIYPPEKIRELHR